VPGHDAGAAGLIARGAGLEASGTSFENDLFDALRPVGRDDFVTGHGWHDSYVGGDIRPAHADTNIDKALHHAAINPLVSAAGLLLWLAGRLNESAAPEDIGEFRNRIIAEVRRFDTAAMAKDVPGRTVKIARYALCAAIDDIILNTQWGGRVNWASGSLVGSLYNETWGGERFYDLLSQLLLNPEDNIDALELMAICLAIGFVGKYRVIDGGQAHLTRLRHDLYRTIRRVRGPYDRSLSEPWETAASPYKPPRIMAEPGLAAIIVLALLATLWIFSSISLRGRIDTAAEQIMDLAPAIPISVNRDAVPTVPQPARQTQMQRLSALLEDDIAAGNVEVVSIGDHFIIRMLRASFPSGGQELAMSEEPLVDRIATTLNGEKGPILVIGHTDNIPVASGSRLASNMAISQARANSVARLLRTRLTNSSRVNAEGRGETDPITTNATAEGRARNRRVEFRIEAETP
jgi:type VI secretion system protein ImpK